jgi:hypothetical protein
MLVCSFGIGTMKENLTLIVVKGKSPTFQRSLTSGFEKRPEHPISSGWLQNGMNDESP